MGKVTLYQREATSKLITLPRMFCCAISKDDFVGHNDFHANKRWSRNGKLILRDEDLEKLAVVASNILPVGGENILIEGISNAPRCYTESVNGCPMRVLEENVSSEEMVNFYEMLCVGRIGYISSGAILRE